MQKVEDKNWRSLDMQIKRIGKWEPWFNIILGMLQSVYSVQFRLVLENREGVPEF